MTRAIKPRNVRTLRITIQMVLLTSLPISVALVKLIMMKLIRNHSVRMALITITTDSQIGLIQDAQITKTTMSQIRLHSAKMGRTMMAMELQTSQLTSAALIKPTTMSLTRNPSARTV